MYRRISSARKSTDAHVPARKRAALGLAFLAVALPGAFGLAGCASGSGSQAARRVTPAEELAAQRALFRQERERMIELVACARRHGIHLPEPDAHNNVNTRGAHIRTLRNKAILTACAQQAAGKGREEQREAAREQAGGPRRLGEEPAG